MHEGTCEQEVQPRGLEFLFERALVGCDNEHWQIVGLNQDYNMVCLISSQEF